MASPGTDTSFDALRQSLAQGGTSAMIDRLAEQLIAEKRYHELFDLRLMQSRLQAGLPVILTKTLDELPEGVQEQVEQAQLTACREVGDYLLGEGRLTEAWMYLRIVGARKKLAAALATYEPDEEEVEKTIVLALQEAVNPRRGLELVIEHHGTCAAVTTFEQETGHLTPAQRENCAALMVEHLHEELLQSVRMHIEREAGEAPAESTIGELVEDRDWLFAENAYHIDTSHLSMTVRFARWVTSPDVLQKACDLCEYGRRLSDQFQYESEVPFEDLYGKHLLFFQAQLGNRVDEAVEDFGRQAREADLMMQGTLAAEVYLALLTRLGRYREALEAHLELLPAGQPVTGLAPTMMELARLADACDRLQDVAQQRGDRIGFAAGLLQDWQLRQGSVAS